MKIERIIVRAFRNISNCSYDPQGKSFAVMGNNKIGKTNLLNAAYWCLTGADIENNTDDSLNVPSGKTFEDESVVCDVIVDTDKGTVQRKLTLSKGALRQSLIINNVPFKTLKAAEAELDKMLGILQLTINSVKDFHIRRFLLNPMYVNYCKESALREFIVKQLDLQKTIEETFHKLPESIRYVIADYVVKHNGDISKITAEIKKLKDENDKKTTFWSNVKEYLKMYHPEHEEELKNATTVLDDLLKINGQYMTALTCTNIYGQFLQVEFEKVAKSWFKSIDICFLEKGKDEGTFKNVCYPYIPNTDLALSQGSTSERIVLGCQFIEDFIKSSDLGLENLPLFIDEFETIDNNTYKKLITTKQTQIICAKVKSGSKALTFKELD